MSKLVHTRIRKEFEVGLFNGTITHYTPSGYFHVKYDDDDSEDLSADEVHIYAANYRKYMKRQKAIDEGWLFQVPSTRKLSRRKKKHPKQVKHKCESKSSSLKQGTVIEDN